MLVKIMVSEWILEAAKLVQSLVDMLMPSTNVILHCLLPGITCKGAWALHMLGALTNEANASTDDGEEGVKATDSTNVEKTSVENTNADSKLPPTEAFAKMTISQATSTLTLTALVCEHRDQDGCKCVTVDILMLHGACSDDVDVTFVGNKAICIDVLLPKALFNPGSSEIEKKERNIESIPSKRASLKTAAVKLQKGCKMKGNRPCQSFALDLPVPVKQSFRLKPFVGTCLNDCKKECDADNHYQVLHLDFSTREEPSVAPRRVKQSKAPMASPLGKALDPQIHSQREEDRIAAMHRELFAMSDEKKEQQ